MIVLHGLNSSKEFTLATLYSFATAGFDAMSIDLDLHGERPEAINREQMLKSDFVGTVSEIIYQTAEDIPLLCRELGIELSDAGVLGISAGGFAAHILATGKYRCRALVAAISSPDWLRIDPNLTPDPNSPEGMLLQAQSPVSSPERYPPLPICMLNREFDTVVSSEGSKLLHQRLQPLYKRQDIADRLNLTLFPGEEHVFTDDMLAKSVQWFQKHL